MRDALNSMTVKKVIAPVSGAASDAAQTGTVVDVQGYEGCTFVIATGALADADATFTVLVEDSADNSTFAAVADEDLISQGSGVPETNAGFQFDDDDEVRTIGYRGTKRYVRLKITPATNTGAWLIGAVAVLTHRRNLPFAQPAS